MTSCCEVTQKITEQDLRRFGGTSQYYRHNQILFPNLMLTDGCHFLRENAQCYWLFDAIASHLFCNPRLRKYREAQEGLYWELVVEKDDSAHLSCHRDIRDDLEIERQEINYTDIGNYTDIETIEILTYPTLFNNRTAWVCLLPSEY